MSIQVSQLCYAYKEGQFVLKDLNLMIGQGELTVILGASGCGKSTLLRLLAGLEEPTSGWIAADGIPMQEQTTQAWYAKIGYVPQEISMFTSTIRDNIRFGRMDASQADTEQAAAIAQIHDRIIEMPHSYDTVIGETEGRLSGGEEQRLALARAIIRKPGLLLLDEPTSSLDIATESKFMAALHQFKGNKTVVLITHKLSIAQQADRIVVMKDGAVAESGSHAELISMGGLYCTWMRETEDETVILA